jgi:RNA polymerase sigma-70 factor, ECF subfamily
MTYNRDNGCVDALFRLHCLIVEGREKIDPASREYLGRKRVLNGNGELFGAWRSGCHDCSVCRSACPSVSQTFFGFEGNKFRVPAFYYVSGADLHPVSFEELAMPLFDPLYNFAFWMTRNRDEAEDLVQETYAKALKGFASFQPGTNFRAWMYRILRNTFLTSRTGLKATMTVPLDPEEEEDRPDLAVECDTPETILIKRSSHELLQSAIDELPVHFREILLLCEVEEMSYQEISEALTVPIGTVMSRLSRARQTLRNRLRPHLQQEAGAPPTAKGTNHGL